MWCGEVSDEMVWCGGGNKWVDGAKTRSGNKKFPGNG